MKILPFWSIFAHVILKKSKYRVVFSHPDWFEPHIFTNKMHEFIRRYFSKTLKSCHLGVWPQRCNSFCLFFRRITIPCFFFISYPKKWCLQNINMSFLNKVGEELKKKCKQKKPDMHSVNIGISGYHHVIISEVFYSVFNIECGLQ